MASKSHKEISGLFVVKIWIRENVYHCYAAATTDPLCLDHEAEEKVIKGINKKVWDFLIHLSFLNHRTLYHVPKEDGLENEASRFVNDWSSVEPLDCAVCLSTIEEDDEIQVLRCKHLFHRKCLDRCVEYQHTACPLCRDYLAVPRMVCELGRELIVFSFCGDGSSSDDDYGKWWLR
ncbi:zinc finger, RING/FYVE/PHD-type containing protein [Tanacetum coccineum]